MLNEIRLRNFKCYRDTGRVRLRPLTLLIGPNNAGKSTLLQSLLLLKQTYEDREPTNALVTSGPLVDLGSFHDILRGGATGKSRSFSISMAMSEGVVKIFEDALPRRRPPLKIADRLTVSFVFSARANEVRVGTVRLSRKGEQLMRAGGGGSWDTRGGTPSMKNHSTVEFMNFLPQFLPRGRRPKDPKLIQRISDLFMASQAQNHLWFHVFEDMHHVAPLRLPIPRYNVLGEIPPSEIGAGGENLLRVLRSEERVRGRRRRLLDLVDEWLSKRFGFMRRLRLEKIDPQGLVRELLADEREGYPRINVANMGSGVSQLLPIIAGVVATRSNHSLLVEQPEVHLHPAAQADLGDLFIDSLGERLDRQFIIETHSEHLLLRIRRRVAEGKLDPRAVSILFVERGEDGSVVRELPLDKKGHIAEWPDGFFEEGYVEALGLARAASGIK